MKNTQKHLIALVGIILTCISVSAQSRNTGSMSDTAFLRKNIADNIMEIQLAENGRDKGSPDTRKIAKQMISDHAQILADLRKVASKKGMKDVFADPGTGNNFAPTGTPDTTTEANGTGITGSKPSVAATGSATTSTTTASASTTGAMSTGNSDGANGSTGNSNSGSGVGTSTSKGTTGGGMAGMSGMGGMQNLSEKEFSKAWNSQMLTMHQAKLRELHAAAKQVTDPELLAAINKAIPKVTSHVEMLLQSYKAQQ